VKGSTYSGKSRIETNGGKKKREYYPTQPKMGSKNVKLRLGPSKRGGVKPGRRKVRTKAFDVERCVGRKSPDEIKFPRKGGVLHDETTRTTAKKENAGSLVWV